MLDTLANNVGLVAQEIMSPTTAAALTVGLATIAAGFAEKSIGTAAMGAIAEDKDLFGQGLILTVIPETLVILALVTIFVV